ncbi:hypothetical protein O181_056550 [Austropuccinia psidii MF-1]|uniref:Uncharacterized protein n=1 Tax=Austropuccinia psidii MF-1 TaxID=1389203 RepID=A0A9Q3HW75_9BASI|nr:hypothetical protein [Austropuccinia psidii MF-1]
MSPVDLRSLGAPKNLKENKAGLLRTRIPWIGHHGEWKDPQGKTSHNGIHLPIQQAPQTRGLVSACDSNQSTSMTAKYHKPMVKPRYHQNMELIQISSKGLKQKRKPITFQIPKSHHHRTRNNKVVAEHQPYFSPLI